MGYYGGERCAPGRHGPAIGALPQIQPACADDAATGLVDCGNWAGPASWAVPGRPPISGIYFAKLVREDGTAGASHVVFVVRDDDGALRPALPDLRHDMAGLQPLRRQQPLRRRPGRPGLQGQLQPAVHDRGRPPPEDWVFNSEYPMVRWLERNGYDVSYTTGVDSDRRGAELHEHRAFLSVGHDEYWSGDQRANVEAARDAGVNLAFFSGNEVFWKTRWEDDHRTLVSYKETHADAKIDRRPASGPAPGATRGRSTPRARGPRTR